MSVLPPCGWLPVRVCRHSGGLDVAWADLRGCPLSAPFFDHAVDGWFQRPYPLLSQWRTPVEALLNLESEMAPQGFVFHLSRCGSTLVSQLLGTVPGHACLSEASVIGGFLRHTEGVSAGLRVSLLRGLLSAMARPVTDDAEGTFFKFEGWQALYLPLFRAAFPGVPWIFLYREPLEVMVSLSRLGGGAVNPGVIDPALLDLSPPRAFAMPPEEYHARLLGAICAAAGENHDSSGRLVNYVQIPGVVWSESDLPRHFGFSCGEATRGRMEERAVCRGKTPAAVFRDDSKEKRDAATESIRAATAEYVQPWFEKLEALRLGG